MRIGILGGTGPAGSALGARLASVGFDVVLGSRSKERAMDVAAAVKAKWPALTLGITGGDNDDASACDVIVLATPWDSAATTAVDHLALLRGKVVISMANALVRVGHEFQPLLPPRGSVAAHVQAAVPECRVVAAFHHLPATELGHLGDPIDSDVLICSDYAEAKKIAMQEARSEGPAKKISSAQKMLNDKTAALRAAKNKALANSAKGKTQTPTAEAARRRNLNK